MVLMLSQLHETIVDGRLRGESVRRIARRLNISESEVDEALDIWAHSTITYRTRFTALALELERLDRIQLVIEQQALATGDLAACMTLIKICERRCILLGLAIPPRQADAQVVEAEARPAKTSTGRLREVIDQLLIEHKHPDASTG